MFNVLIFLWMVAGQNSFGTVPQTSIPDRWSVQATELNERPCWPLVPDRWFVQAATFKERPNQTAIRDRW